MRSPTSDPAPRGGEAPGAGVERDVFRLLVASVIDAAIFVLDPEGRIETWNIGAERIKGYAAAEVVGKHFSIFFTPEDVAAGHCEHELDVAAREGRFEQDGWRIRKDGSRFWANVVITALRGQGGELIGFAKLTRDLTERVRAEEARIELEKAGRLNQAKSNFLRLVSHEFRSPLAALKLQLTRLSHGRGALAMSGAQAEIFGRMLRTTTRLNDLVESLLSYARIDSGRWELKPEVFDAVHVVHAVVDEHRPTVRDKPVTMRVEPSPEERLDMVSDPQLVRLVLTNLVGNALKFTEQGCVDVSVRKENDDVLFAVQDSGPGIPAEWQARIFEPFEQVVSLESKHLQGFGLGLALVKEMVTALGGRIELRSEVDAGSTFVVQLPTALPSHAPRE